MEAFSFTINVMSPGPLAVPTHPSSGTSLAEVIKRAIAEFETNKGSHRLKWAYYRGIGERGLSL
jgi:hypothetical protein